MTSPIHFRTCIIFIILIMIASFVSATPIGPQSITVINSSTWQGDVSPKQVEAQAGNVTELYISGSGQTQTWQGYYGEITGTIFLQDSDNYTMFDWQLAEPQGEIYASATIITNWDTVHCFNYSAQRNYCYNTTNPASSFFTTNATQCNETANPDVNWTHYYTWDLGTESTFTDVFANLSDIESGNLSWSLGLISNDYDGVDETFNITGQVRANFSSGTNLWVNHTGFEVGTVSIVAGTCPATDLYEATCTNMTDPERKNQHPTFLLMNDTQTASMVGFQNHTICDVYHVNPSTFNDTYIFNVTQYGTAYSLNLTGQTFKYQGSEMGSNYQEVLLAVNHSQTIIYTTIIENNQLGNSSDPIGYDNRTHDFQLIVGDDGHVGPNQATTTTYYFYVELG